MDKEEKQKKHISVRRLSRGVIAVALIVIIFLFITIYNCIMEYHTMHENTEIYIQCEQYGDQMKEASDYLTEQARLFVLTGEQKYLSDYIEETEHKRRRNKAVENLAEYFENSDILLRLQEALESSEELKERECYAMKLVWCAGEDKNQMPEMLQLIKLSAEDEGLSAEEKLVQARTMVFDEDYEHYKTEIYQDVELSVDNLIDVIHQAQMASSARLERSLHILQFQSVLVLVLLLLFAYGTRRILLVPLKNYVKNMDAGEKLPQAGVEELAYVAETYNAVYDENKKMLEVFRQEAVDAKEKYEHIQEEKRKSEVIMGLSNEFAAIYLVNFEEDKMIPYRINHKNFQEGEKSVFHEKEYRKGIREVAEKYILPEDREAFLTEGKEEIIRSRLKQSGTYSMTFRCCFGEDRMGYLDMYCGRIPNEDKGRHVVMGFKDVTERVRKVQEQTEERIRTEHERDDALHANRAKSAFLFNISHDIRTPMNAIIGFTTVARKYMDRPTELEDCLDKIEISSSHLLELINNILDMSQIESGQLKLEERPCNLRDQLETVVEMFSTQMAEKKIVFSEEISIKNEVVYADALNFRRIFLNILGNAVRFTKEDGKILLKVTQQEQKEEAVTYEFMVRDTGIGMSAEFMQRMFDTFEREMQTVESSDRGTGLGLAITKNLVELMGGTITAESKKAVGTTFTLHLTFRKVEDGGIPESRSERITPGSYTDTHFTGYRLLVAEDNELNREIVKELLMDAGFEVEIAHDGSEAVKAVKNHAPGYYNLVLMDIQMPVMNGYEATEEIRAMDREDAKSLPIVALSANAMDEDRRKSAQSGMNAHVAKPIDLSELLRTIEEYI